jgi:hypothetical protein
VRLVELGPPVREGAPGWEWVVATGPKAGLRAAARSARCWLQALPEAGPDTGLLRRIRPGRLKRRFPACWIDRNLPTRLAARPLAVQGAFALAPQERLTDATVLFSTLIRHELLRIAHLDTSRLSHIAAPSKWWG